MSRPGLLPPFDRQAKDFCLLGPTAHAMRWWLVPVGLLIVVAGCVGALTGDEPVPAETSAERPGAEDLLERWQRYLESPEEGEPPIERVPGRDEPTAVVAVIAGGINPFHEHFEREALLEPGSLPVDARDADDGQPPVYVPTGTQAARDAGQQAWLNDVVEEGTLYRFAGTNLLFYQVPGTDVKPMEPGTFGTNHGTFTAGLAASNAPIVVLVHSFGTYAKAWEWAAAQPWIDVITTQRPPECLAGTGTGEACPHAAVPGPVDEGLGLEIGRVVNATRHAWDAGKLLLAAGGNDPRGVTPVEAVRGPPWVAAVGGADTYRGGATVDASQTIDLVSNFTNEGPHASETDAYYNATGTSGAAPLLAGTVAHALADVREKVGHRGTLADGDLVAAANLTVTNVDVWEAMNRTAVYWNASDWDPTADHPEDDAHRALSAPVNPLAPWTQTGWGYLGPSHADELAEGLLTGELPAKPAGAQAWMEARQDQRRALWSR